MPSVFPGAIDALNNPSDPGGDKLNTAGVLHDEQHANANDSIEAIENTLGTNPAGPYTDVGEYLEALAEATTLVPDAAKMPLLSQAAAFWDARSGLNEDGNLPDLSGRGNHLILVPGNYTTGEPGGSPTSGPAFIAPDPARGRSIYSPGWDDMWWETDAPGGITELDVAWEGDLEKLLTILPSTVNWIMHQGSTLDGTFSWAVGIEVGTGLIIVLHSDDGTTVTTVTTSIAVAETGYERIAVTMAAADGDITVYRQGFTDPIDDFDLPYASWENVDVHPGSGPVTLFDSSAPIRHQTTADPDKAGSTFMYGWHKSLYRARVRDEIEGTNLMYLDTDRIPAVPQFEQVTGLPAVGSATSAMVTEFLGRAGETLSLWNYETFSYPTVVMDRPFVLFGNGSMAETPVDDATFDIADDTEFSIWCLYTAGRTTLGSVPILAHKETGGNDAGYCIFRAGGVYPHAPFPLLADGTTQAGAIPPPLARDGGLTLSGFNLDRQVALEAGAAVDDDQTLIAYTNGEPSASSDVSTFGSFSVPGLPLRVASWSVDGDANSSLALAAMVVFRRTLTPYEISSVLPYELGATDTIPEPSSGGGGGAGGGWSGPQLKSGWYAAWSGSIDTRTMNEDRGFYVPFPIQRDCTVDRIAVELTAAATGSPVIRFGMYADDGGEPGALIADYGTAVATAPGVLEKTISQALTAADGQVWLCVAQQGGSSNGVVRATRYSTHVALPSGGYFPYEGGAYSDSDAQSGALADPAPAMADVASAAPRIALRVV